MNSNLKAGVTYFALVFSAGFVLGTVRTLWIIPHLGVRVAELMESPFMLVITILVARWTVLHFAVSSTASSRILMGGIGIALMFLAELGLLLGLRRVSIREYIARRDPVSGTVYYLMLGIFATMPLLGARRVET